MGAVHGKAGTHLPRHAGMPLWRSGMVIALLLLLWVAAAGPRESVAALGLAVMGAGVMLAPPESRGPRFVSFLLAGCCLLSLLPFLPLTLGEEQPWRGGLEEAGLPLGSLISAQPVHSLSVVLWQLATGLIALRFGLGGHRKENHGRLLLLLVVASLLYGGLSMVRPLLIPEDVYSAETGVPDFGFFPNRNHSATLLAIGLVLSVGLALHGIAQRKGSFLCAGVTALLFHAYWLVFCNSSRAGILLSGAGILALLLIQLGATRRRSYRRLVVVVLLFGGVLLYAADEGVKKRLVETLDPLEAVTGEQGNPAAVLGWRLNVYRDTVSMIASQSLIGVGAGQFADCYPQFQKYSIVESGQRHVHPESSWLWLAAEGGVGLAGLLLVLVSSVFLWCWKNGRVRGKRGLRPVFLVAAALPFLHGFIDVPLHRESILWMSAFLLGLAGPEGPASGVRTRWLWRGCGAAVSTLGILILTGLVAMPSQRAAEHLARARQLLKEDQIISESGGRGESEDLLERALSELEKASSWRPLDWRVHALNGNIALYFDDKDETARQSFLRQRLLDPGAAMVPYRQGLSWRAIDPGETTLLWREALARADGRDYEPHIVDRMLRDSQLNPALRRFCAEIAGSRPDFAVRLLELWSPKILRSDKETIATALHKLGNREILKVFNNLTTNEFQDGKGAR